MSQKQPMSLEDLPKYLEEQRKSGGQGSAPVVGMGTIVTPEEKPSGWLQKSFFAAIMVATIAVSGFVAYDIMSIERMTVTVGISQNDDPFTVLPRVISESGGRIIEVKKTQGNTYEVRLSTRRSSNSFLDLLRRNKSVYSADLKE